jgi:hypothetical protein
MHDTFHIHTRHGVTCLHTSPDNYDIFAVWPCCRSAIPHPIIFAAGHVLRLRRILASDLTARRFRLPRRVLRRGLWLSHREC